MCYFQINIYGTYSSVLKVFTLSSIPEQKPEKKTHTHTHRARLSFTNARTTTTLPWTNSYDDTVTEWRRRCCDDHDATSMSSVCGRRCLCAFWEEGPCREIKGFEGFNIWGYFSLFDFKCTCEKNLRYVQLKKPFGFLVLGYGPIIVSEYWCWTKAYIPCAFFS